MSENADTEVKRNWRWGRIILVGSLALNLLVIGAFVGSRFAEAPRGRGGDEMSRQLAIGPYGRALSQADRRKLGEVLKGQRAFFKENRRSMRDLGHQVAEAVRADPFDPERVAQLFETQRRLVGAAQSAGQELLLKHLIAASPEERAAFADRLERGVRRKR